MGRFPENRGKGTIHAIMNDTNITSIILYGFRGSGKTTIGQEVAKRLEMPFFEMDDIILRRAGKSIAQLTENGTQWKPFRDMEHMLVKELSAQKRAVISTGGGTVVNTLYGEQNLAILRAMPYTIHALLTAGEGTLGKRIREREENRKDSGRPILTPERAKDLEERLRHVNDAAHCRTIEIEVIINDSLAVYDSRKSLYEQITKNVIDTGKLSVDQAVQKIIQLRQRANSFSV